MSAALLALSSSLLLARSAIAQNAGTGSCTDVHIFLAKGWNEQYDDQRQTKLVDAICSEVDGSCDYEDIILNNLSGSDYCTAVTEANGNGKQQLQAYAAKCPNSKLVMSGYSEGAQVVGDIMAGGGGNYDSACTPTSMIDAFSDAVCQLAAIMTFGNPRHVANAPYNADSGVAGVGSFPRTQDQAATLAGYSSKLHDWCNINDPVCAEGLGTNQAEPFHTNYFDLVTSEAASWALSKINSASSCGEITTSSSMMSSSTMAATSTTESEFSATETGMISSAESSMTSTEAGMTSSTAMGGPAGYGDASSTTMGGPAGYGDATSATSMTPPAYQTASAAANMTSMVSVPASTSVTTMISGKPACVSYGVSTTTTTYGPYPPYPVSSSYPVTTSWIGWGNGTATMTSAAMGSGTAAPSGSMTTGSDMPSYTGAAGSVKVASGLLAAVGVFGAMMA